MVLGREKHELNLKRTLGYVVWGNGQQYIAGDGASYRGAVHFNDENAKIGSGTID